MSSCINLTPAIACLLVLWCWLVLVVLVKGHI
jgi:hypothetical protein